MKRFRSARIGIGILEPILVFSALLATVSARPAAAQQYSGAVAANCLAADLPRERYQPSPPSPRLVAATSERRDDGYDENLAGISAVLASGDKPDYRKALKLFEHSARKGYVPAEVNLAIAYLQGLRHCSKLRQRTALAHARGRTRECPRAF